MNTSVCKGNRIDGVVGGASPLASSYFSQDIDQQHPLGGCSVTSQEPHSVQAYGLDVKSGFAQDPEGLLTHVEMCQALGISPQTGYDWRNPRSPRYKEELANIAIYLSERTVRFRRVDVQLFALQKKQEGK